MKKNKMLYRIVAAVLACAVVALALVTYQSRSSSNAPVAEGAVTATGSAKGMEGDVVVEVTADARISGHRVHPADHHDPVPRALYPDHHARYRLCFHRAVLGG